MVTFAEKPLRDVINVYFHGKEPYQIVRATALLALFIKFLRKYLFIASREGVKEYLINLLVPYLKKLPMVQRKLGSETQKLIKDLQGKFAKENIESTNKLPASGMSKDELLKIMDKRKHLDTKNWQSGQITGSIYHGGQDHYDFIGSIYAKWGFSNPLHPSTHPALRQMDGEVVQMVINMYNGNEDCCGSFTTGGTESILMAMKTYRDWGKTVKGITEPNIVICVTAHAAFEKAGKYFGIFVKEAKTDKDQRMDLDHMRRLIDSNTVAIVGSACQFAHGSIDPIEAMAKIALQKNIGLHVDCCLGGFLVPFMDKAGFPIPPFDFRVKGVTTISCDPHKYGFAPKGSSVAMFATKELRHHMYTYCVKWTGGIYATAGMCGSRPGGPVAATWAVMCQYGEDGYIETTKQIVGATRKIAEGIKKMEDVELVGVPEVCVVAFAGKEGSGVNCYAVSDCMQKKFEWELQTCQNPPCIHLALTLPTSKNAEKFLVDLEASVKIVKNNPSGFASTAGLYGMAASLPASFLEDSAATYLDVATAALK